MSLGPSVRTHYYIRRQTTYGGENAISDALNRLFVRDTLAYGARDCGKVMDVPRDSGLGNSRVFVFA